MAKNLILNALVDNLGTYVEDLKKEHLKLSLSTGQSRPRHRVDDGLHTDSVLTEHYRMRCIVTFIADENTCTRQCLSIACCGGDC